MLRSMASVVEILKHEYIGKSVMKKEFFDYAWKICMCATGPSMLTAAVAEVIVEKIEGAAYRIAGRDFSSFKGRFKASSSKQHPLHYMKVMGVVGKSNPSLLKSYSNVYVDGTPIQCVGEKAIYIVMSSKKRVIPDYSTFLAMNLTIAKVQRINVDQFEALQIGDPMPPLAFE